MPTFETGVRVPCGRPASEMYWGNVHTEAYGAIPLFGEEHFQQVGDGCVHVRAGFHLRRDASQRESGPLAEP